MGLSEFDLGEVCNADVQCKDTYAECSSTDWKCVCQTGYYDNDGSDNIGGECTPCKYLRLWVCQVAEHPGYISKCKTKATKITTTSNNNNNDNSNSNYNYNNKKYMNTKVTFYIVLDAYKFVYLINSSDHRGFVKIDFFHQNTIGTNLKNDTISQWKLRLQWNLAVVLAGILSFVREPFFVLASFTLGKGVISNWAKSEHFSEFWNKIPLSTLNEHHFQPFSSL